MIGISRRRLAIELDDLERAARVTLLQVGEWKGAGEAARGTRVCLRVNPDELAAIGLPRSLVAGDLQRSLDEWAARELPTRTPVDVDLVPDRSLKAKDVRVWLGEGRERLVPETEPEPVCRTTETEPMCRTTETETETETEPESEAEPVCRTTEPDSETETRSPTKRDRIPSARRSSGRRRVAGRGSRGSTKRRGRVRLLALLAALLAAVTLYVAGPALADTYAAPGPAPDVVLVDGQPASGADGAGAWWPWLGAGLLAMALAAGATMAALAAIGALLRRRRKKVRSPAAESFPPTMAHRVVSEGTRERAEAGTDATAVISDLRQVRDVAVKEGQDDAVHDALAIEQDLHWIRQRMATAPAGRLAAARGAEADAIAAVDADCKAANALRAVADQVQALRERARAAGGDALALELAALRQRTGNVRGMVARRPALIID